MAVKIEGVQLPVLKEKLQAFLPDTFPIYYTLDNAVRGRLKPDEVQFYVDHWPDPSCVAVVSPRTAGQLYNYRTTVDLWVEKANTMTKLVLSLNSFLDWSQVIFFRVPCVTAADLEELKKEIEVSTQGSISWAERHIYSTKNACTIQTIPSGYRLPSKLNESDAETVGLQYSAWGVKPDETVKYFQACCSRLPSSGIHTDDGVLVSYVALHHTGAFGSVVTDSNHRRKGLGKVAVSDICRKLLEEDQAPYVFVNPQNVASAEFYKACGFEFRATAFRIRVVPQNVD